MKKLIAVALLALPVWAEEASPDAAAVQRAYAEVLKRVSPAVVSLEIDLEEHEKPKSRLQRLNDLATDPKLREYYKRPEGPVSGVIVGKDGYILTTYYAVDGTVHGIQVHLSDGRTLEGELLGRDQALDLALVKVDAKGLPTLEPADISKVRVGEFVMIVGRSPDPERANMTAGIVSADGRSSNTAIQTDAEIDYGNLGGALVDLDGRLVGIAAQLSAQEFGLNSGVGYVTRWDCVEQTLPDLKAGRVVTRPPQPFLGVQAAEGALEVEGAQIDQVLPDSAAEKAGLRNGDVIREFQGERIKEWEDLSKLIHLCKPGDEVKLTVRRGDTDIEIIAVLGERK